MPWIVISVQQLEHHGISGGVWVTVNLVVTKSTSAENQWAAFWGHKGSTEFECYHGQWCLWSLIIVISISVHLLCINSYYTYIYIYVLFTISTNIRTYIYIYCSIFAYSLHDPRQNLTSLFTCSSFSVQVAILGGGAFGTAMATHVVGRAKVMRRWWFIGHPMLLTKSFDAFEGSLLHIYRL